eukprot:11196450-Lingulodinium_polyedra.AAC.1
MPRCKGSSRPNAGYWRERLAVDCITSREDTASGVERCECATSFQPDRVRQKTWVRCSRRSLGLDGRRFLHVLWHGEGNRGDPQAVPR